MMFQNQQTNILVYAVKSDDGKKTNLLKPDKSFMYFSGALSTQRFKILVKRAKACKLKC